MAAGKRIGRLDGRRQKQREAVRHGMSKRVGLDAAHPPGQGWKLGASNIVKEG